MPLTKTTLERVYDGFNIRQEGGYDRHFRRLTQTENESLKALLDLIGVKTDNFSTDEFQIIVFRAENKGETLKIIHTKETDIQ